MRGTVRDALRRYPSLGHDELTALSSELWARGVEELRLAAVVLLQSRVGELQATDLTRVEGFVRDGERRQLVDLLAVDVVGELMSGLDARSRGRAELVLDRWSREDGTWLRRAALLAPLRELRAGGGDVERVARRIRSAAVAEDDPIVAEALALARAALQVE
ncbi:DNA alkylation repair protein [Glaciibacter flavus]|uniref:DNA alkylation repair protein n=1 Tax=Orlajensenia flava TaxID=2565934 RepID=UPI003AFF7CFA